MKVVFNFTLITILLTSCNFYSGTNLPAHKDSKVWLYMTFNLKENGQDDFYYYYGRVDSALYEKMNQNRIRTGFIRLANVRYWTAEDKLRMAKDETSAGTITFRIEDIVKMDLQNGDPLDLYDAGDIDEKTQEYINRDIHIPAKGIKETIID